MKGAQVLQLDLMERSPFFVGKGIQKIEGRDHHLMS